jgi:hypothetical protein
MSIRRLSPVLGLLLLAGCSGVSLPEGAIPTFGLPGFSKAKGVYRGALQKTVEAGRPTLLWGDTSLAKDCAIAGDTQLEVIAQPSHGAVVIKPGQLYALYPEGDRRAGCSGRLVDGVLAFYTGEKGYAGVDQAVLRGTEADGEVHEATVNIIVRAPTARARPASRPASKVFAPSPAPMLPPAAAPKPKQAPTDPDAPVPTAPQ